MPSTTRRRLLRTLATGGLLGLAGCVADRTVGGPKETTARTTSAVPTSYEPTTTVPDERVSETPPGSPPLDPSGEWPEYRFDPANTGHNPDGTGLREATAYWRLAPSGPATLVDGTLFNLTTNDHHETSLTRRNPATAAVESRTSLVQYGTNAPPSVADGRVYVTTFIEAFCLDANSDAVAWRGPKMNGIQSPPTVVDGTVFVDSGGFKDVEPQLRAFDAETGEGRWRYRTGSESKSTPAVADGRVFVGSDEGLHAVDAASGEGLYVVDEARSVWATPAVADGTVYVTSFANESRVLLAVDAADGTVRWRTPVPAMKHEPPVVTGERVYVGTESGVVALDPSDGTQVAQLGGSGTPVARVGDVVYATGEGTIHALDAAGAGPLWSHTTAEVQVADTVGRTIYGITPVDGAVYVSARDALYGFGPPRD